MIYIAIDKESKKILGYIKTDIKPKLEEVFANYADYDIIETEEEPPILGYENYKVEKENDRVSFSKVEKILTELERKKQELEELKRQITESNQTLLDFLEGEITMTEYAETKIKRKSLREQIKTLEAQIKLLSKNGDDVNGR